MKLYSRFIFLIILLFCISASLCFYIPLSYQGNVRYKTFPQCIDDYYRYLIDGYHDPNVTCITMRLYGAFPILKK